MRNDFQCILVLLIGLLIIPIEINAQETSQVKQRFNLALKEISNHNYHSAKGILLDLLAINPTLHRARAELVIVQIHLNEIKLAQSNIALLLSLKTLPNNVKRKLYKLKSTADKKQASQNSSTKHMLSGNVIASMGHDNNLKYGSINDLLIDDSNNFIYASFYEATEMQSYELFSFEVSELNDITGEPIHRQYNTSDSFWRQKINFRHKYNNTAKQFQWRNDMTMVADTAFALKQYDRRNFRFDSHATWYLNSHWITSFQVYTNRFHRGQFRKTSDYGIQPEISYLSTIGKFTVRTDLINKYYENETSPRQHASKKSILLSWSMALSEKNLLMNVNIRRSKQKNKATLDHIISKNISTNIVYKPFAKTEVYTQWRYTDIEFTHKPSISINQLGITANYQILPQWKAFVGWEFNKINNHNLVGLEYRNAYQLGLSWSF